MSEYLDIAITNVQLHVQTPRKPKSVGRALQKALRSGREHRAQTTNFTLNKDGTFRFAFQNDEISKLVEQAQKQGKKVRFVLPKDGVPVYPGKDTLQFLASKRGQKMQKK